MADTPDPGKQPARTRTSLPDISSRAWEHPADKGALVALRKLKGFDTVLKTLSGLVQRAVGPAAAAGLGGARRRAPLRRAAPAVQPTCGAVLDAVELPEMYVRADPTLNADTVGMDKPIIVIDSGLVDLLDDGGAALPASVTSSATPLSGHAVYQTLLRRLLALTGVLYAVPGGAIGRPGDHRPR